MPRALDRYFDTPGLHCLALNHDDALFIPMDRESYRRSIFLDHRASTPPGVEPAGTPVAPLIAAARDRPLLRTGWIFHVAHCGSTLLSRMIDSPEAGLVLREPPPLRQLGLQSASGHDSGDWSERLKLAYALVARRFDPSQPTVVKANVPVNFILPQIVQMDPGAPVILLYLALEPYLLAVLRDSRRRGWVDRVTRLLEPALAAQVGLDPAADTVERAAALWLAQILIFNAALRADPAARSLDAEAFFASPRDAAEAAAIHLGRTFTDDANLMDEITSTHSKDTSRPFDEAARRRRQADDRIALRDDLDRARRWIERAAATTKHLPQSLNQPLFGAASSLLS